MKNKILIVEDDVLLGEQLTEALEAEGYTVTHVTDGKTASSEIKKDSFDLCLLDFKLKDTTGAAVLKEINKHNPSLPVFILTGKPDIEKTLEEEKVSGLTAAVIQKPFKARILLEKINSLLSSDTF